MVASLPMTCAAIMVTDSATTGLTLPGMMLLPLQRRQCNFRQTCQRTAIHPAQIIGDLHQADAQHLELARELHGRILTRQRFEVILSRPKCDPGTLGQMPREDRAELRSCVDACAH